MATGYLRTTELRFYPYLGIQNILLQERVPRIALVFFQGYECHMTVRNHISLCNCILHFEILSALNNLPVHKLTT